jgi:hypothetical protein
MLCQNTIKCQNHFHLLKLAALCSKLSCLKVRGAVVDTELKEWNTCMTEIKEGKDEDTKEIIFPNFNGFFD